MPADSTFEDWVNKFLPPAIRLWTTVRVQGAFDPRKLCDQRQYEYTLPTHVFLGPKPSSEMGKWLEKARSTPPVVDGAEPQPPITSPIIEASAAFWASRISSGFTDDVVAKKKWRITKEALEQAREFVKAYEGSHNFYNFTVGKDFRDRSCQRVMRKLEVSLSPFATSSYSVHSLTLLLVDLGSFRRQRYRIRFSQLPRSIFHASSNRKFLSSLPLCRIELDRKNVSV